jgi:hypothetical protein
VAAEYQILENLTLFGRLLVEAGGFALYSRRVYPQALILTTTPASAGKASTVTVPAHPVTASLVSTGCLSLL